MKKQEILAELESLAKELGYRIRYELGDFSGGSCLLNAEKLILINKRLPPEIRMATLARIFADMDLNSIFIKPAVREYIEDEKARQNLNRETSEIDE